MVILHEGSSNSEIRLVPDDLNDIFRKLQLQLNEGRDRTLHCSFPRRIDHLSSGDLQEKISEIRGPGSERLQNFYASIKIKALKDSQTLVVKAIKSLTTPEAIDLRPVISNALNWLEDYSVNESFQNYFIKELLPPLAQHLHFEKKKSSPDDFCSDPIIQTILHLQQKFFMIDPLGETNNSIASLAEQNELKKILIISLKNNLTDLLHGLEIEYCCQDNFPKNTQKAS